MEDLRVAQVWARDHCASPGLQWAPIQEGLEPPSTWIVRLSQLGGLFAVLLLSLLIWEGSFAKKLPEVAEPPRTVAFSLRSPDLSPLVAPGPSPSGVGHVRGTDSIDPALKKAALVHRLPGEPMPVDPAWESTLSGGQGGTALDNLDLSLPEAAGGTGWARGFGRDATRGGLKAEMVDASPRYDRRLVVLLEQMAYLAPPFTKEDETVPVVVLLTIGEDGVPIGVRPLSGPRHRYPEVIAAAMKWRFEPLAPHGLTAPHQTRITFYPRRLRSRRW